jgi:molybdenum cofactor cytidylyltransferase
MAEIGPSALVLLAAGSSTRMGQPKQLLAIGDRPLLRHVVEASLCAPLEKVVVVLGANAAEIRPSLNGLPVDVIVNDGWAEGMGSSVRAGIQALGSLVPNVKGVIIALADQPGFSADHIARLLEAQQRTGRSIVASRCGRKLMPPAFFSSVHFPALLALQGDAGARALFQSQSGEVAEIEADNLDDLDTPAEYASYLKQNTAAGRPLKP